jgi:TolB-like protein
MLAWSGSRLLAPSLSRGQVEESPLGIWAEVRRRRVPRVVAVYAAAGWVIVEVSATVLPMLDLPEWSPTLILVLILAGFPVAVGLAWAYQLTPDGVVADEGRARAAVVGDSSSPAESPAEVRHGIVVLPFDNMSPNPDDVWFSDGLTEEIITNLSRLHGLRVISRNSSMALKAGRHDTGAIARRLGVRYVLEGSVRKSGDDLRITAQLIDAEDDDHLWAERYIGTMESVFAIQESVARAIAEALEVRLTRAEEDALSDRPIEDVLAYEYYLRGRAALWRFSEDGLDEGLSLVERGIGRVGENPLLLALKGQLLLQYVNTMSRSPGSYGSLLERARDAAEQALSLAPEMASAIYLKGVVLMQQGRPTSSVPLLAKAVTSAPDDPDATMVLGYQLAAAGSRPVLARALLERSVALDPLTPMFRGSLGWEQMFDGDFDRALCGWSEWQELVERGRSTFRLFLAWMHAADGNTAEANRILNATESDSPLHPMGAAAACFRYALAGERENALAAVTPQLSEAALWDDFYSLLMADSYALVGEHEESFRWLEHAIDYGIANPEFLRRHEPFLEPLRSDDRFAGMMEKAVDLSARVTASIPENFARRWT